LLVGPAVVQRRRWTLLTCFLLSLAAAAAPSIPEAVLRLDRRSKWRQVRSVPLGFDAGHPQGLVRRGQDYWLSSVEVEVPPRRYFADHPSGYDRDHGLGTGHLFRFDSNGALLASATIGKGTRYHPGGMDFDGRDLWVPVAEYRPGGSSSILRVDPETLRFEVAFEVPDHVGALAVDKSGGRIFGASWGSRTLYTWDLEGRELSRVSNPSHYVDIQDWKYLGQGRILGGGVSEMEGQTLGGLELWEVSNWSPLRLVPLVGKTDRGVPLTQNPLAVEMEEGRLRLHLVPEDGQARLLVIEADLSGD
jgi:hypothetical protein